MSKFKKILLIIITIIVIASCLILVKDYYKNYKNVAYSKEVTQESTGKDLNVSNKIPVLMYHDINNDKNMNLMKIDKKSFEEQMKYLKDNNYNTLTIDQFYDSIINGKKVPKKSVLITFDDGYEDHYKNAYPVLKKYNLHATMFIITDYLDKGTLYLKSNELKEMSDNGIDIESHTTNHPYLDKLTYEEQLKTLQNSKSKLEDICKKSVRFVAYPYGAYNTNTIKADKKLGYMMAFTTKGKWADLNKGAYALNRIYIFPQYDLNNFKDRIDNPSYSQIVHPIKAIEEAYYSILAWY
ncbi:peptidoglycan/xylan/chitin deacetylase (PgdA/CDA1 family) [Clostridium acetobutylicum]|uniref:Predicted xylanase/chitin deacetilase, similar to yxkH B.subtilis n=1 Tax=Clostridium acetobutylicum (strain ATCC 824 / DSM 792 / JCM 1419 / IAM 19013 / LMG 5710 / NBRC 13948 / NRRL B-527 / VKM B-1787 / 2291 / W) TaxID=272562 RepID=Q97LW8_CLOAB|nr:polysaccharide deacetylase family protein [Clostridium acetobutylicum]AAK78416.1 Predicted xylanase/chitin deacetilase, similar to yxkH B.subtilis [Clostridium acetobutylicum ATCC 824]ADZ19486.1 xylanase/chitin deacetylase [Clostridium acetobutylicum EA 2018]AEI31242.1 xylanase/chitin deacetylase [Clostridium acetobutylicum DSM 1731]PSM05941.1 polysaccharide deacetylase family protein [Clostridium sp. NJ4]AWV80139.1 polysaccharide deacetylase family protein [Clostridium acetobutylicum]